MASQTANGAPPGPLARKLAARIMEQGPIPVSVYMDACLNDSEYGYYATSQPLGHAGDFITAPEISQVFGEILGLWAASVWQAMGAPEPVALIELGPGRGTLAADALRAATAAPDFRKSVQLRLVETSPVLRAAQAETLAGMDADWFERLEDAPDGPAIILANEFLDSLPVRQLVRRDGAWRERCVAHDAQAGFHFVDGRLADVSPAERALLPDDPAEGDIAELRPGAMPLLSEVARRGAHGVQAALFIDYGHTEPPVSDTLQAVSGHRYADVLAAPGQQDLTAHVDFRALARHAEDAALRAYGPMPQGHFLLRLGLENRCQTLLRAATLEQQERIMSGVRRLVDPTQMGELFKVMAVTAGLGEAPPPFGDQG